MIVTSDNRCGVTGLNIVGYGAQDAALAKAGFPGTRLASPQRTTARDVAKFFEETRNGTLLPGPHGAAAAAELYGLLNAQQVNDRLPTGLPAGVTLAHKTGDRIGWAHDAAIVHAVRGDIVIVVLSGPWAAPCCDADHPGPAEKVAFAAIAEIGRRVYDAATAPA
jgi:beta-lactamase class A